MFEYKVKEIVKVYDGDTVTVKIDLGFNISITERIRLLGINAPEVRGESREAGLASRDWLRQKLEEAKENGYDIILKTKKDKKGKYGRYLGYILINGPEPVNLNMRMIQEGHAVQYGE